jgi:hypothetical protein
MIKKADWVKAKLLGFNCIGFVQRVAKDGSWADVRWKMGNQEWSKRMPSEALVPQTTIRVGDWEVTDVTRELELKANE